MHHLLKQPQHINSRYLTLHVAQVRFCVYVLIKPYVPPILYPSVNSFNFRACAYTNQVADSDFSDSLKRIVTLQRMIGSVCT